MTTREDFSDFIHNLRRWLRNQPRTNLLFALVILGAVTYVIVSQSFYTKEYHMAVEAEIDLAKRICENSGDTIAKNKDLLKLDQGDLRDVIVEGKTAKLKYVKYPKVMFFETGVENIRGIDRSDVFCVFSDPRSASQVYYYDYNERGWKDRMRFRFRH